MTRKITLLALVSTMAIGLSACGSSNSGAVASASSSSMSSTMPMPSESSSSSSAPSPTSTSADAAQAVISIADFAYTVPASVAPGAKITIKNADTQAHTVTSKDGGFDVKVDPKGSATMTAPSKPGTYTFVCTFHANMTGTLVVK
jgi:plastocyanin